MHAPFPLTNAEVFCRLGAAQEQTCFNRRVKPLLMRSHIFLVWVEKERWLLERNWLKHCGGSQLDFLLVACQMLQDVKFDSGDPASLSLS